MGRQKRYGLKNTIANLAFGDEATRTMMVKYPEFVGKINENIKRYYESNSADSEMICQNIKEVSERLDGLAASEDLELLDQQKGVHLFGHQYIPKWSNGKIVILFTGSGSPGAMQVKNCLKNYIDNGVTVVQFDYRGFGKSVNVDEEGRAIPTQFCESGAYEDAHLIYEYVVTNMKSKPSDIILHGYSMGAPIAAKLAADLSRTNEEKQKPAGLVLHSPMVSIRDAYQRSAPWGLKHFAGFLGTISAGKFDTVAYLEQLKQYDPDIPLVYIGGGTKDWLCPSQTRIFEKIQFNNQSIEIGDHDHCCQCKRPNPSIQKICKSIDSMI